MDPWRAVQRKNIVSIDSLCAFLKLDEEQKKRLLKNAPFSLNLPLRLAHKIAKGRLDDPILRQFAPLIEEERTEPSFSQNPVGDCEARCAPRLLKKYAHRALLMPTAACAMHCRYCFRRHFAYGESTLEDEIKEIEQDRSLKEVILSGGDPLSLSDTRLKEVLAALALPHIKRIRFHSRFPVGIPERIDASLLSLLASVPQQVWFVLHINHPNELDPLLFERLEEIKRLGIPLLNQTVLLKGVNDSVAVLQPLFEELVDYGISPYYVHQLDRVEGAAHFEVAEKRGEEIMRELATRLSGYALPRYVREEMGKPHKTAIPLGQGC